LGRVRLSRPRSTRSSPGPHNFRPIAPRPSAPSPSGPESSRDIVVGAAAGDPEARFHAFEEPGVFILCKPKPSFATRMIRRAAKGGLRQREYVFPETGICGEKANLRRRSPVPRLPVLRFPQPRIPSLASDPCVLIAVCFSTRHEFPCPCLAAPSPVPPLPAPQRPPALSRLPRNASASSTCSGSSRRRARLCARAHVENCGCAVQMLGEPVRHVFVGRRSRLRSDFSGWFVFLSGASWPSLRAIIAEQAAALPETRAPSAARHLVRAALFYFYKSGGFKGPMSRHAAARRRSPHALALPGAGLLYIYLRPARTRHQRPGFLILAYCSPHFVAIALQSHSTGRHESPLRAEADYCAVQQALLGHNLRCVTLPV